MGLVIKVCMGAAIVATAILMAGQAAAARTYENARQVGKRCSTCHTSTAPNVTNLNDAGRYFLEHRTLEGYKPGAAVAQPTKPPAGRSTATKADAAAQPGLAVYNRVCLLCHGAGGRGTPLAMPLTGQRRHAKTEAQAIEVITNGVKGTAMAPFKGALTQREIRDVARYVMTLTGAEAGK